MKRLLLALTMVASFIYVTAQNPFQPKKETLDAMQKISFLTGDWKGEGWIQMGPQKHSFNQTESIALKLNGTIIQIEGEGKDQLDPSKIIHQAFALISYDAQSSKYLMKSFRGDGSQIDANVVLVDDHTFQWGFSTPMTGQIKFTISVMNNKWTEVGEMSRDGGTTWNKYFEMTLVKQ